MASQPAVQSEQNKGKGKHVSTACSGCRRRKIKCDGITPRCSNCVLYDQECIFQYGVDKRKIAPKERLQALTAYCHELEAVLGLHGIPLPTPPPLHVQNDRSSQLSPTQAGSADFLTSSAVPPGWPSVETQNQSAHDEHAISDASGVPSLDNNDFYLNGGLDPTTTEVVQSSSEPDMLVDQLSGRMGSLQVAEDGQLRFYGATSNLHILHNGPLSLSRSRFRSLSEEGNNLLQGAGVGHLVDQDLEDHLLKLYFCWEDPTIHVVEESVFWRERRKSLSGQHFSPFYSEVLSNAMCSVGATMTARKCPHLPEPLPDFFATRSKLLLDLEMDAPTLSTVQSFVILSAIEAALTRDARGWLDSGMAVRLAVDLGLHLDPEPYVQAGVITREEEMIRKVIWGGVFVHDRMWSLYVGRPVALDDKHITVRWSQPKNPMGNIPKYWTPYTDDGKGPDSPVVLDPIDDLCIWNIKLCAHMTAIRETLYPDGMGDARNLRQLCDFASGMSHTLTEWKNSLPESLSVNYDDTTTYYLPHVLQLHMQYHCVMIITNRPFFVSTRKISDLTTLEISRRRDTCTDAADDFAKLVDIYRHLYGLKRINIQAVHLLFTATLIHVFTACGALDKTKSDHAWKSLEICCQALSEMSLSFKNAGRAFEVIMSIKSDLLKRSRSRLKRANPWHDGQDLDVDYQRKRRSTMPESELLPFEDFEASGFDPAFGSTVPLNFFDTSYDDFSLDSLFWTGFNSLELPHLPPQNQQDES